MESFRIEGRGFNIMIGMIYVSGAIGIIVPQSHMATVILVAATLTAIRLDYLNRLSSLEQRLGPAAGASKAPPLSREMAAPETPPRHMNKAVIVGLVAVLLLHIITMSLLFYL